MIWIIYRKAILLIMFMFINVKNIVYILYILTLLRKRVIIIQNSLGSCYG